MRLFKSLKQGVLLPHKMDWCRPKIKRYAYILLGRFIFLTQIKCSKEMPTSGNRYEVYMIYTELNAEVNLCDLAIRNGTYNVTFASPTSFLLFKVFFFYWYTFERLLQCIFPLYLQVIFKILKSFKDTPLTLITRNYRTMGVNGVWIWIFEWAILKKVLIDSWWWLDLY